MDFKLMVAQAIAKASEIDIETVESALTTPPNADMGDFAFPCFVLAKQLKKSPIVIAKELAEKMQGVDSYIDSVNPDGGYLNVFINKAEYANSVLKEVLSAGNDYGKSGEGNGKNICLDYSSINIAKPFHIGHLSTTVIGNALSRIYTHLGYKTISINHLGDWGTQFGKLIVAYKLWGVREEVEKGSVLALMDLYVRYHEEAEKNPKLDDEARAWFRRIEDGNDEAVELFDWFKKLTLQSVQKIYDLLGVEFDSYAGESFYTPYMPAVIKEMQDKGVLKVDDGATIVDLSQYNMPPCLILKSDGATLYATRDITTAIYRKNTYDFHKLLYVVAYQQSLHFKQFFKVLELMGYDWVKDCEHVSYGMVSLEDGAMSTRKGKVVLLDDVLTAAIEKSRVIIEEKNPDLEDKDEVAKQVGVGAVVWLPLYNNRIKDIVFSYDKALNFDGETAPYAQYTHARCCSVLKKAEVFENMSELSFDGESLCDSESIELVKSIDALKDSIRSAAEKNEPYIIARRVIDICGKFNRFYYERRIMGEEESVQNSRLALCAATKTAISIGLYLLGVHAPERM